MSHSRASFLAAAALAMAAFPTLASPAAAQPRDLVFRAITPCRVVDSRIGQGIPGLLAAGATHGVTFRNKCGIPGLTGDGGLESNSVAAVAINVVAVNPDGPGHVRAWPSNEAMPLASIINYSPGAGNVANGVIVPMCDQTEVMPFPCQSGDISFRSAISNLHLVIDVTGYFVKPTMAGASRYGLTGIDEFLCVNNAAKVKYGLSRRLARWDNAETACPAGSWVCLASERGAVQCDTARPDSFLDALKCDGTSLDFPATAHLGWVRNQGSTFWAGMALSEVAESPSENIATCASLPVWCCSKL